MLAALLKLISFRDYFYGAVALAALAFWLYHDHVERAAGAAKVTQAVAIATARATAEAATKVAALNSAHADDLAQVEERYENLIRDNDTAHSVDLEQLRQRASSSGNANRVLESAPRIATPAAAGTRSPETLGVVPAEEALSLADALRADDAALSKCYDDRDSLTGK